MNPIIRKTPWIFSNEFVQFSPCFPYVFLSDIDLHGINGRDMLHMDVKRYPVPVEFFYD